MLTSLDWLVIVFMIMVATSFLSLCLMFLVRRPHIKRVCFYIVVALSIYAASVGIRIRLGLFPIQISVIVVSGAIGSAVIVIDVRARVMRKNSKLST